MRARRVEPRPPPPPPPRGRRERAPPPSTVLVRPTHPASPPLSFSSVPFYHTAKVRTHPPKNPAALDTPRRRSRRSREEREAAAAAASPRLFLSRRPRRPPRSARPSSRPDRAFGGPAVADYVAVGGARAACWPCAATQRARASEREECCCCCGALSRPRPFGPSSASRSPRFPSDVLGRGNQHPAATSSSPLRQRLERGRRAQHDEDEEGQKTRLTSPPALPKRPPKHAPTHQPPHRQNEAAGRQPDGRDPRGDRREGAFFAAERGSFAAAAPVVVGGGEAVGGRRWRGWWWCRGLFCSRRRPQSAPRAGVLSPTTAYACLRLGSDKQNETRHD